MLVTDANPIPATHEIAPFRSRSGDTLIRFRHIGGTGFKSFDDIRVDYTLTSNSLGIDALSPAPLTDIYDADRLEFVSASIPATSTTFTTTPYSNTGVLNWANLGPIPAGGGSATVTVTFRALEPPDSNNDGENDSATTTNSAQSTGGFFLDGFASNNTTDTATVTVDPTGSITGVVWADSGPGRRQPGRRHTRRRRAGLAGSNGPALERPERQW